MKILYRQFTLAEQMQKALKEETIDRPIGSFVLDDEEWEEFLQMTPWRNDAGEYFYHHVRVRKLTKETE